MNDEERTEATRALMEKWVEEDLERERKEPGYLENVRRILQEIEDGKAAHTQGSTTAIIVALARSSWMQRNRELARLLVDTLKAVDAAFAGLKDPVEVRAMVQVALKLVAEEGG